MTAHAERSAGDGWIVEETPNGFEIVAPENRLIATMPKSVGLEIAHQMAAAPLAFEAINLLDKVRQHFFVDCDCDDDCAAAIAIWADIDRCVAAALQPARVPDEREVQGE